MAAALPCGERLIRCLTGGDCDRTPFGIGLGWAPWGSTLARWRCETGRADLDPARELGYDAGFALPEVAYGIFPGFEKVLIADEGETRVWRDERGITRRDRKDGASMPEFLDYPVKSPDDWRRLKQERLRPDPRRLRQDWDAFRARLAATGEAVQVGCFPWGVFGTVRDLMGAEALLYAFYDQPAMVRDMMETLTDLWLWLYGQIAAEVPIDHLHIWEDMSGRQGSLISPAMVEAFMMPCYDRLAAFAAAHGVRLVSMDSDGDVAQLLPLMTAHGVNAVMPFEVQAGCDIAVHRRRYPDLGIMYGLDKRALASGGAVQDREVARCRTMLAGGRYLPGFDHLIPDDVPWAHFRDAALAIKDLCHLS
jgi:uroporphyrinogen decarboxylase